MPSASIAESFIMYRLRHPCTSQPYGHRIWSSQASEAQCILENRILVKLRPSADLALYGILNRMELYPHQTLGNVPARKFILADEQGLGKTVTALLFIYSKNALLVVCKSALLETGIVSKTWLPNRSICKIPMNHSIRADVYLVTFDVSARRQNLEIVHNKQLLMVVHRLKGVIIDEGSLHQECSNHPQYRITDIIRKTDDVIFLTGTPLVNDPKETAVLF